MKVSIVNYNPNWETNFEAEYQLLTASIEEDEVLGKKKKRLWDVEIPDILVKNAPSAHAAEVHMFIRLRDAYAHTVVIQQLRVHLESRLSKKPSQETTTVLRHRLIRVSWRSLLPPQQQL